MNANMNRIRLNVWGERACFTRPEMKVERVSYDVITPSAARGVLEAIYWKPQIRWIIERIQVLKPIRFTNVRRNELGGRGPSPSTLKARMEGRSTELLEQCIESDRQQRASTILDKVQYLIEARFVVLDPQEAPPKHYEMFKRRASKGQCFHRPYLGCREFVAHFAWHDEEAPACDTSLVGERDLGWMLYDFDFTDGHTPQFFRARMIDGVIDVPDPESPEVVR
ncbi:MAG: type I-C CRISPR-associated protein Cas5c [Planctomycetota bacterium]|jgi:CRISPR-associated protein Cas5d|nr:type I-C CRISPR-associated protein Cas5c [Planctomycetota bacterium]